MKKIGFAIVLLLFAIMLLFVAIDDSAFCYYSAFVIAIIGLLVALSGLLGDE
ncbi:MAG: hypothetical protein PUB22_07260 [Clostridiales bacterium]|nr:hypothetical protein [Clostridiales bacterium]